MDKAEVIEEIKNEIEDYMFKSDIYYYIKGYLDALNNLNEKDLNKVQKIVMGKYWLS